MVTARLAEHVATARDRSLPDDVALKARLHLLDTVAAMVSGARLDVGRRVLAFARATASGTEAGVLASRVRTGATAAALANGMLAHADETDDSHAPSLTHPGCAVVPAAFAAAEATGATGEALLRAVVAGYDVGPRIALALGGERFFVAGYSSHAVGGLFGAAAAAGVLYGLDAAAARSLFGYTVQMASGNACWRRDAEHVEKAFDFGGMAAMNGTLAAQMVAHGFTGVCDALEGEPGLFTAFAADADPGRAVDGLGERFEIMRTAVKKWCVGSPIQAALDALEALMAEDAVGADSVEEIVVALPATSAKVVDDRAMPDVNLQHQLSLMLIDGTVTFASTHDHSRMTDPAIVAMKRRIRLDPRTDEEFATHTRQAIVTARRRDGTVVERKVRHVRGTPLNPMMAEEVVTKARDLMGPVLGPSRTDEAIEIAMSFGREPTVGRLVERLAVDECDNGAAG